MSEDSSSRDHARAAGSALEAALDLYECELADIADAIDERAGGDTTSDDGVWMVSLPAGHWRCLSAYVRQVLAPPSSAKPIPGESSRDENCGIM